jgi:hypothetical protein
MSHRAFEADPVRKSFVDLPGESRNAVYSLAMFKEHAKWEIHVNDQGKLIAGDSFCRIHTRSLLRMLAAVNKEIEQESWRSFWTNVDYEINSPLRFVPAISGDSKAAFASFKHGYNAGTLVLQPADLHPFFMALPDCVNLTYLDIDMALDGTFWNAFSDIWSTLETENSLRSTALDNLVQTVSKLPYLERILIRGHPYASFHAWRRNDRRVKFAYTGWPAEIPWNEIGREVTEGANDARKEKKARKAGALTDKEPNGLICQIHLDSKICGAFSETAIYYGRPYTNASRSYIVTGAGWKRLDQSEKYD